MPRPFATPTGTPAAPCFLVSTTVLPGSSRTPAVMPAIPRPNLRAVVCALADEANARIHTSNATPVSAGTLGFLEPLWPFIGYLPCSNAAAPRAASVPRRSDGGTRFDEDIEREPVTSTLEALSVNLLQASCKSCADEGPGGAFHQACGMPLAANAPLS